MPMMVPKRPTKGETAPIVASQVRRLSIDGQRFAGGRLRGALQRSNVARRSEASRLAAIGLIDLIEHVHQGAGLELLADRGNLLQAVALRKARIKRRLCARARLKAAPLAQDNRPGVKAGDQQDTSTAMATGPLCCTISKIALPLR